MIHVVQADRPGDDNLPDFLVNDVPDPDSLPDTLYLSDGSVAPVNQATNVAATLGTYQGQLTATMPSGWTYLQVADPGAGLKLARVVRSDGKVLRVGDNVWQTDRSFPNALTGALRERLIHLLDFDGTGSYTLYYTLRRHARDDPAARADRAAWPGHPRSAHGAGGYRGPHLHGADRPRELYPRGRLAAAQRRQQPASPARG